MKNFYKIILILLISNLGFSQTSKTIHNKDGLTVSYALSKFGNSVNPGTGTTFSKYKLRLTVQNSTSKFWAYNAINSISSKNVKSGIIKLDDETFCWNGGRSNIDHFCIEDNCSDFPRYSNVAAPHQVICPSSKQECEKTFLYPTDLVGEPEIEWTSWGFIEMLKEPTANLQNTNLSKNTIGQSKQANSSIKKVEPKENKVLSSDENYQLGDNYYDGLNGFPKDYVKARFYYEKVNSNDIKEGAAACCLSSMYKKGNGVAVDLILAEQYAKKKRALGVYSSCR